MYAFNLCYQLLLIRKLINDSNWNWLLLKVDEQLPEVENRDMHQA